MLVDTDVLIWNLRGNRAAAQRLDDAPGFWLSAVTYMELVQGMRNKQELRQLRIKLFKLQPMNMGHKESGLIAYHRAWLKLR